MTNAGMVTGAPRHWLRLEAAGIVGLSLVAMSSTKQSWWLIALVFLAPDLSAMGYALGHRWGSWCYNLAHASPAPLVFLALGWWSHDHLVLALALVWLMHLGFDRLLGYGLKYEDDFQHTHLGRLGARRERAAMKERPTTHGDSDRGSRERGR